MLVESLWTDTSTADLTRMWGSGKSASEIANVLGFCTRSAVLGKVHRLGLEKRRDAYPQIRPRTKTEGDDDRRLTQIMRRREKARRQRERYALARMLEPEKTAPPPAPVPLECRPCSLLELTQDTCRFPIGDPGEPDFHFCGAMPRSGDPYCIAHCRIAYRLEPRRRAPFIQQSWRAA